MAYVFANGTGTAADPYQVATAEDLNGVRDYLDAHFKQTADIDLSGYANWEPIGTLQVLFTGSYNGQYFEITNLNSTKGGLFKYLTNATVQNVLLKNININSSDDIGGIGVNANGDDAKIFKCGVEGILIGRNTSGICNIGNQGIIEECYFKGLIEGTGSVSGIKSSFSGTAKNCYVIGEVIYKGVTDHYQIGLVAGIGSWQYAGHVFNCYFHGEVQGRAYAGGINSGHLYSGSVNGAVNLATSIKTYGEYDGWKAYIKGIGKRAGVSTSRNFYNQDMTGTTTTGDGTPITLETAKTEEFWRNQAEWDMDNVWAINPAKNDGYPYLQWQQFDPPPDPFQPWTPPKLEPSWWEGFKLPFNVLELDEDAPIAIQRNFKEIEHYINFLGKASGEIKDNLELLATAPAPMSEEEMPDPEPEVPPTDSYFAGYILGKEGQMGSIDAAIKTDSLGGINEVWIARVIDKQGIVEIYDSDAPEHIFRTVAREFNLPLVNLGADVVDVAIEFDGTYDQYNIFVSEASPHIFWVERTGSEDIIYTIKWDGVDPAPEPIELARAQLGYLGSGITVGLDPNITV